MNNKHIIASAFAVLLIVGAVFVSAAILQQDSAPAPVQDLIKSTCSAGCGTGTCAMGCGGTCGNPNCGCGGK
ncbi:MAG: hypothetical protein WC471_00515 [Candidatus Woesearchaeota archaeon]